MLLRLRTIALLVLASLRVNAATVTGVIITKEAVRSPAVSVAAVYQIQTRNPSGSTDLGSIGSAQNQTDQTRRELEESLKAYRELAKKAPETHLPQVAATLNNLGILDSNQNRIEKARKEFEEALKTYRELAHKEPDIYLRDVATTLNNLGILEGAQNYLEEALKIYHTLAQKERESYLPYIATTLNNLGIVDSAKNRMNEARKEYAEALKMYR